MFYVLTWLIRSVLFHDRGSSYGPLGLLLLVFSERSRQVNGGREGTGVDGLGKVRLKSFGTRGENPLDSCQLLPPWLLFFQLILSYSVLLRYLTSLQSCPNRWFLGRGSPSFPFGLSLLTVEVSGGPSVQFLIFYSLCGRTFTLLPSVTRVYWHWTTVSTVQDWSDGDRPTVYRGLDSDHKTGHMSVYLRFSMGEGGCKELEKCVGVLVILWKILKKKGD